MFSILAIGRLLFAMLVMALPIISRPRTRSPTRCGRCASSCHSRQAGALT